MTWHVTFSIHAKHPLSINLVELLALGWPFIILKAPNSISQPTRLEKDLATFKSFYLASSMGQSSACRSSHQNLHHSKDELVGKNSTKGNNRYISTPAVTRAPTPAVAPIFAPLATSGSANSSVVRYSKNDLQQIVRIIFEAGLLLSPVFAPVPAPVFAAAPHYEGPRERSLKARFLDIYRDKTQLECYNFFQQYESHFATAGATSPNRVLFAATFLKNTALFCWQQHQRKIENQTNALISLKRFKAFLCQSLNKFEAFVNTIWSTIRKDFQH